MTCYTKFGRSHCGASMGICSEQLDPDVYGHETCWERAEHWFRVPEGDAVGVCEGHRGEAAARGWEYLGHTTEISNLPMGEAL